MTYSKELRELLTANFDFLSENQIKANKAVLSESFGNQQFVEALTVSDIEELFELTQFPEAGFVYATRAVGATAIWNQNWVFVASKLLKVKDSTPSFNVLTSIIHDTRSLGRFRPKIYRPLPFAEDLLLACYAQSAQKDAVREGVSALIKNGSLTEDQSYLLLVSCFAVAKAHTPKERREIGKLIRQSARYSSGQPLGDFEAASLEMF